jgi:hypothetical protein
VFELTRRCLTQPAGFTDGVEYSVIIVDNGSTDGTAAFLAELGGDVHILRNAEDGGSARVCLLVQRAAFAAADGLTERARGQLALRSHRRLQPRGSCEPRLSPVEGEELAETQDDGG